MLEDLQSDQFKLLALENIGKNLTQMIAYHEILVILNCLNSDNILPQLVPMLESGGIVEVIQIYLKSKYVCMYVCMYVRTINALLNTKPHFIKTN